ncbi:MAG: RHS repeat-associated core domain-containing protein [Cognatishimia sp.]|nr:RHS repeat-associated core domain-containing protein [Cognatishimia sp.]
MKTTTGSPINARFPGQWYQSESALHQNWMRDYDPTTGRYIQADPLGLIDGASVYGYVMQSPLRQTDPTGLCPICVLVPVFGGGSATSGTVIGGGSVIGAIIGGVVFGTAPTEMGDGTSTGATHVPWPQQENKRQWTCTCRANKDGRSTKNCPDGPKFALGTATHKLRDVARRQASRIALSKLGAVSSHHTQCRCVGPKGQRWAP